MCFTVQLSKIIFRIAVCLKQLCYYIMLFSACQEVFSTFLKLFLFLSYSNFDMLSHPSGFVKNFFYFFLTALWSLWDLSDATLIGYHRWQDLSISFLNFSYNLFISGGFSIFFNYFTFFWKKLLTTTSLTFILIGQFKFCMGS